MAIVLDDNIRVGQQKPADDKYFNNLVPYTSVAEANTLLLQSIRHIGLTININNVEYWYKGGIGDNDLVIKSSESGGQSIISDTYENIKLLVDSSSLVPESTYIITDYQTKHLIPNSDPQEINIGNIEPLTLIAATTNTFYVEAKSSLFPSDIIHYRFDDDSCEDGTRDIENKKWTGGTPRTGYIQYRKSTTNNLSTYYDWRNYKVRRWKLDAVEWVSASIYNQKDIIKSPDDLNLYVCKKTTTALDITDPSQDPINYQLYLDLTIQNNGGFLSPVNNSTNYYIGNINNTNIIINNTTPDIDYKDYYTFCILTEQDNSSGVVLTNTNGGIIGEGFKEFEIGKFDFDYFNYEWGNGTDLESNVFYLSPNGNEEYYVRNNVIGSNFNLNTIGDSFNSNTIGDNFSSNTIWNNFYSNTIGNNFSSNTIGDYFSSNTIWNNFYSNTIGDYFSSNTIGDYFSSNTIGDGFSSNTIVNGFNSNTIGDNFSSNTIWNNFYSNTIGNNFQSNTTGNNFKSNTIGDGFSSNTIGDYFSSNTIGNGFNSNTIGNGFSSNTIGNDFNSNTIGNGFSSNTIGDYFNYNTIGNNFYKNTIGDSFYSNTIGNDFYSNTIGYMFQYNKTKNIVSYVDWLNAVPSPTHVYQSYNCTIFKNSANVPRLSYYNENDQLVITNITA